MPQTIAERLAEFALALKITDIPAEVLDKAKSGMLDTVGLCVAAAPLDYAVAVRRLVSRWGGAAEATAIGSSVKVPAQCAAFANGVLAHGQDYDETHTEATVHGSAALVPAALAMAESVGASGSEMLI